MAVVGQFLWSLKSYRHLSQLKRNHNSFIHIMIYMAPLKEIYSEAPTAQPRRCRSVLTMFGLALQSYQKTGAAFRNPRHQLSEWFDGSMELWGICLSLEEYHITLRVCHVEWKGRRIQKEHNYHQWLRAIDLETGELPQWSRARL